MILDRVIPEQSACRVNLEGLRRKVVRVGRADRLAEVDAELDELYRRLAPLEDRWYPVDEQREKQVDSLHRAIDGAEEARAQIADSFDYAKALRYLWGKSSAPERRCSKCDFVAIDADMLDCPVHETPLKID